MTHKSRTFQVSLVQTAPCIQHAMSTHSFGWVGAFLAFIFFNAIKGVDMMMQAYVAYYENRTSDPGIDGKAEGKAYVLNYFLQMAVITAAGGYVAREREVPYKLSGTCFCRLT